MKYVSFLFAIALAAGVANAAEKSLSFNYSNHNAYYACSFAEAQMTKTLTAVGATDISVSCTGGIEHNQFWPVSVDATFSHELQGGKSVVLKGRESCEFNVKMIQAVASAVDAEVVKAQDTCWDADGNYKYELFVK